MTENGPIILGGRQRPKPLIANICSEELADVHLALKGKQKRTQPPSNSSSLQNNRFSFAKPQISTGCTPAAGRRHGNHSKSTEQIVTPAESPERGVPGRTEERMHHISTKHGKRKRMCTIPDDHSLLTTARTPASPPPVPGTRLTRPIKLEPRL